MLQMGVDALAGAHPGHGGASLSTPSIVSVIDDDASVRAALSNLLLSRGYVVYTFGSAEDFLGSPQLNETSCVIYPGRQDRPRHPRQLRHARAPQGPCLAPAPPALRLPLHADLGVLAERRGGPDLT